MNRHSLALALALAATSTVSAPVLAQAQDAPAIQPQAATLPTGQALTPLAVPGAKFVPLVARTGPRPETVADGAAAMSVSPDGRIMLVLTSGYNRVNGADGALIPEQSVQYVFVYALDAGGSRWLQTLSLPNSYSGIAWLPNGKGFVVPGGVDDNLHTFVRAGNRFVEQGQPIALGHAAGVGAAVKPQAAGVAVSPDGTRVLVANYYNDSVSLIDLATRKVVAERDLRPGKNDPAQSGVAGGEYPFAVVWRDNAHAYVSASRDREIVAIDVAPAALTITARIATIGAPTALLHDAQRKRLYAVEDNDDRLAVIDSASDTLLAEQRLNLPAALGTDEMAKGLNPNALAQLPDGRLLLTYGGINAVALIENPGADGEVEAVLPTGWYPSAVAASRDGKRIFVANRKSPPGPNPEGCAPKLAVVQAQPRACGAANQYIFQLEKAGLLEFPMPASADLAKATLQVASNIGLGNREAKEQAEAKLAALRGKIRHVVFIVKENRTYDQVLGDLPVGNGDPRLAILGKRLSPNHHALALDFVTIDNFLNSGEQSSTGWTWTTAGRVPDLLEKTAPVNYAGRGLAYEAEGADRNIATAMPQAMRRKVNPAIPDDADILPGTNLLAAPDADDDDEGARGAGFLWNAALRAGLTVRNYGFADASIYGTGEPGDVPPIRDAFREGRKVWTPSDRSLAKISNLYFRGFDMRLADYWRVLEWEREFAQQDATGTMPALTLMRLSHDHFGDFANAIDGVNTVETQMADNDYSLGRVVERIANSRFRDSTAIFVIEDDAQNGADHVDARRSIAFVLGAHVRQKAVVSTRYTTVSMIRTMGALLGLPPLGLNDALAIPMADVFDTQYRDWTYRARAADVLKRTQLPIDLDRFVLPDGAHGGCVERPASYWAEAMKGQNFTGEDRLDTDAFNAALWHGLGGSAPRTALTGATTPAALAPCPRD